LLLRSIMGEDEIIRVASLDLPLKGIYAGPGMNR
jgi:hypothetical protein